MQARSRPNAGERRAVAALCAAGLGLGAACSNGSRGLAVQAVRESASPTPAGCSLASASSPGLGEYALRSGGVDRRFLLYVPSGTPVAPRPLVFNLHGSGGTPEGQLELSGLVALADEKGFVLLAPEGVDHRWNVPVDREKPDDVRFVAEAIERAGQLVCIDRQRVYATGFSGGGRMVSQLACELSEHIAAVAAIGGIRFPGPCAPARSFPILAFHGTGDDVNPYAGGGQPYWGTGVEAAVDEWAQHDGCTARREQVVADGTTQITHAGPGCAGVVLYRIEGFGHTWPGKIARDPPSSGPAELSANELLWRFFEQHPLPGVQP